MCVMLEQCVESVCVSNAATRQIIQFDLKDAKLESRQLLNACTSASRLCQSIADENLGLTITHKVKYLINQYIVSN